MNSYLPDYQGNKLFWVKGKTELTISELNRRIYDYVLQPEVLNEIIPSMSGQLQEIGQVR